MTLVSKIDSVLIIRQIMKSNKIEYSLYNVSQLIPMTLLLKSRQKSLAVVVSEHPNKWLLIYLFFSFFVIYNNIF